MGIDFPGQQNFWPVSSLDDVAAVTQDGIGRPEQRMAISEKRLAPIVGKTLAIKYGDHRRAQGLPACELGIGGLPAEQIGHEFASRLRMHRPVRNQQRARTGIEERARC